jgi:hypothetical protein
MCTFIDGAFVDAAFTDDALETPGAIPVRVFMMIP